MARTIRYQSSVSDALRQQIIRLIYISRSVTEQQAEPVTVKCSKLIPYGKASDFTADGIRVHFPAVALYDTLFLVYNVRSDIQVPSFLRSIPSMTRLSRCMTGKAVNTA